MFDWRSEPECFSWSVVKSVLHGLDEFVSQFFEGLFFRDVLSDEAVGIFVQSTLPRVVGVSEVHLKAQSACDVLVVGEFCTVVKGNALAGSLGL